MLKPFAAARVEVPRLESACAVRLLSSLSEVREPSSRGGFAAAALKFRSDSLLSMPGFVDVMADHLLQCPKPPAGTRAAELFNKLCRKLALITSKAVPNDSGDKELDQWVSNLELGYNTSESSSDETRRASLTFRSAREMFQDMDDNLPPEGRGEGGDLIQLTREQCQEMMVPYGSWYRGGIVVLPGHPKGFISKGHTIPKGHSKGVVTKGKGQGGGLSTLEFSADVEAGRILDRGQSSSSCCGSDSWLRMNLDTGAAIHAFPASMYVEREETTEMISRSGHYITASEKELDEERFDNTEIWYTTASGQEIPDMGQLELTLEDDKGGSLKMMSNVTSVHKCLVSASKLCTGDKQEIWLNGEGGVVFPSDGPIAKGLALEYERLVVIHGSSQLLPVYQERGVYNVYFKLLAKEKRMSAVQAVDKQQP